MPDYGQSLRPGISVDPGAADFGSALALARQADDAGLDYLAVQDHAYQPGYLNAWTMLTYPLARTERKKMTTIDEPLADARDMFAAHTMFRREFGLMPGLVRAVRTGDRWGTALAADHIALVSTVLNHHHSGEDSYVWPPLLERCPQDCAPIVGVMEDQHQAIHHGLLQVEEALAAWRDSASADARDALAGAIGQLLPVMKEHLALEEERVVPLIEKYVTNAEYARVGQSQATEVPPDKLAIIFGMFMYETAPEVIDMVVAEMPAEVQPVIRDLAANAYAAYAKELYGIATPARVTG